MLINLLIRNGFRVHSAVVVVVSRALTINEKPLVCIIIIIIVHLYAFLSANY